MDMKQERERELEKKNENQWLRTNKSGTKAESLRNVRDSFYGYYQKAMGRTQNNPLHTRAAAAQPGKSQGPAMSQLVAKIGELSCCPANSATPRAQAHLE